MRDRREFIGGMAAEMRAMLLHLGRNLWGESTAADHLRCEDAIWRECTELMADRGFNMVLIDLAEGLVYPSHPELAVKGSWSPRPVAGRIPQDGVDQEVL